MKMQDIISSIVELIGQIEPREHSQQQVAIIAEPEKTGVDSPFTNTNSGDDVNRFRQIIDLIDGDDEPKCFSNEPNEKYADIDAVTTNAGGGINGPKHPADIKSSTFPMFPDFVAKRGE